MTEKSVEIRKLVTIGDAQVGKSSLIYRVTHNTTPNITSATIGAAFFCMNTKDGRFRLNMWDTAGQERFRSMVPVYLRDVHIIVFVYDITDVRSFEHLRDYWIDFALTHAKTPQIMPSVSSPILINSQVNSPLPLNRNNSQTQLNRNNSVSSLNRNNSGLSLNRTNSQSQLQSQSQSLRSNGSTPTVINQTRSQSYDNNPFNNQKKSVFDEENDEKEYNNSSRSNSKITLKKGESIFEEKTKKPFCIIVANKSDLNAYRKVSTEDGIELAKSINCPFIELSALNGSNTEQFMNLVNDFIGGNDNKNSNDSTTNTTVILDNKGFLEKTIGSVNGCSC